jgi:hypothetical protein
MRDGPIDENETRPTETPTEPAKPKPTPQESGKKRDEDRRRRSELMILRAIKKRGVWWPGD